MDAQQRKTLQNLLKITASPKESPQQQLERLRSWVTVNLGLYQQEQDKEGVELYRPLAELLSKVESVEELQAKL
jgi:hypothetical protein